MTNIKTRLQSDYLDWTGGEPPRDQRDIMIYIESSLPSDLCTPQEAGELLTAWISELKTPYAGKGKFPLGQLVATPAALEALERNQQLASEFFNRHMAGDWSEMTKDDQQANADAIRTGERVFSSYRMNDGSSLWVITEHDRSSTCALLPSDY